MSNVFPYKARMKNDTIGLLSVLFRYFLYFFCEPTHGIGVICSSTIY